MARWTWAAGACLALALAACGGSPESDEAGDGKVPPELDSLRVVAQSEEDPSPGATRWVQAQRGIGKEQAGGVAYDRLGNVVVATNVKGGGLEDGAGMLSGPEGEAFFIARYGPSGERLWAREFPGVLTALTVDSQSDIVAWGTHPDGTDFGRGPLPAGYFLVKMTRDGLTRWSYVFQGLGSTTFTGLRLAADSDGSFALVGTLAGTLEFPGAGLVSATAGAVVLKFSDGGDFLWSHAEARRSDGTGAAVDAEGHVYLAGFLRVPFPGETHYVPFLQRFTPDGTLVWERTIDTRYGVTRGVAVHGNRVLLTGYFMREFTFAGTMLEPGSGHSDGFLVAFDREGTEHWGRQLGYSSLDVSMDYDDGATIIGRYEDGDDLGTGPMAGVPGSQRNLFVAKYDRVAGGLRWVRTFPQETAPWVDVSMDRFFAASSPLGGECTAVGATVNAVDFGTGMLPAPMGGYRDLFLVGLDP